MTTLTQPGAPRAGVSLQVPWSPLARRAAERVRAMATRIADRLSDAYWRQQESTRERFLRRAADVYELERLEREWDRRYDLWRVY